MFLLSPLLVFAVALSSRIILWSFVSLSSVLVCRFSFSSLLPPWLSLIWPLQAHDHGAHFDLPSTPAPPWTPPMAYADVFEAFFLKADMDRDGRINGSEAINFFRAAELPQPTLAKIWEYANEGQTGFLSRQEFYNALKLATVAQTGRELTPELVKAALTGPAAAQIPPPRITPAPPPSNYERTRTQAPVSTYAGPPKSSSSPELHGFGELSRTNSLGGETASTRPNSASSTVSTGQSQAPSVVMTSNPGVYGYDGRQPGAAAPASNSPWPKMTPSDAQRFIHVFSQVDTDGDGKITGEQARQLFLSWQLPRDVLRHVWNLSDEDGDSMLSVREFCTAVYLLEKYTEGRPLPSTLPTGIHLDEPPPSARKVFPSEFPGSGETSWRLPKGSLPTMDFGFKPTHAPDCISPRHLQFSGEAAPEPAISVPHNSQSPQTNTHFINQNKESGASLTPKLTEPNKLVKTQVANSTKHIMTQKEKAEYYRSKLQEIVLFKSQCGSKIAETTERLIGLKHEKNALKQQYHEKSKSASDLEIQIAAEVSTLQHIQEKKRELARALLRLDSESTMSDSHLQAQFDHIAADIHKLRKMLLLRAKALGVEIKRDTPKKAPFGWQPNIQEQAAEWKKGWDTFNDEGFTEVQEFTGPTPEVSRLAIAAGVVSGPASGDVEGENIRGPSQEPPLVSETSTAFVSVTTIGATTANLTSKHASNDKPKSKNEALTDTAVHIHSSTVHGAAFTGTEVLNRDAVSTHLGHAVESATEALTAAGISTFAINVPQSKSYSLEKSSVEVGNCITSDAFGRKETLWKTPGQTENIADSTFRASAWEPKSNTQSLQMRAESKAYDDRALRSRGSFEPEDYFDLSPPRAPSGGGSAMVNSEHSTNNEMSLNDHNNSESFGFLAYTLKESHISSPIFAPSTSLPIDIPVLTLHGPADTPREEFTVFDESGSDAASPSVPAKATDKI